MTLKELRYLHALAEERHFGRAAVRCCVGQSTLSMAVQRLERELETPLIERNSTGVQLTELGERIVARAERALAHVNAIHALAAHGANPLAEPLALGASATLAPYFFPLMLPYLQRRSGLAALHLEQAPQPELLDKLERGKLDALLVTQPFQWPDVVVRTVLEEPLVVLMPARHPLAAGPALEPTRLVGHPLLLPDPSDSLCQHILNTLPVLAAGGEKATTIRGGGLDSVRTLVACGQGLAIVPLSAVAGAAPLPRTLVSRPFVSPVPNRTLAVAWRASFPRHGAVDILIDALQAAGESLWLEAVTPNADEGLLVGNHYW